MARLISPAPAPADLPATSPAISPANSPAISTANSLENFSATLKSLMLGGATGARLTLAVAESLTCGRLQARVGAISGASEFFLGGITAYTLGQKTRHLGVPPELAAPVNSVSEQVAIAMAQGARRLFGADIALATTGYAEPSPAQNIARPFAWIALAAADATIAANNAAPGEAPAGKAPASGAARALSRRIDCPAALPRVAVQQRVADAACGLLLDHLRALQGDARAR